jgi:hypothetical protein
MFGVSSSESIIHLEVCEIVNQLFISLLSLFDLFEKHVFLPKIAYNCQYLKRNYIYTSCTQKVYELHFNMSCMNAVVVKMTSKYHMDIHRVNNVFLKLFTDMR